MISNDWWDVNLQQEALRWDRVGWIRPQFATLRQVMGSLGLALYLDGNRGKPTFQNSDHSKLSDDVAIVTKKLPTTRDGLLKFAADASYLTQEIERLLEDHGSAIWGKNADRSCLLTPDPIAKAYSKDLFYENPKHQDILKTRLRHWVIVKAFHSNTKVKWALHNYKKRKIGPGMDLSHDKGVEMLPSKRPRSTMHTSQGDSQDIASASARDDESIHVTSKPTRCSLPASKVESGLVKSQINTPPSNGLTGMSEPPTIVQRTEKASFTAINAGINARRPTAVFHTPPTGEPPLKQIPNPLQKPPSKILTLESRPSILAKAIGSPDRLASQGVEISSPGHGASEDRREERLVAPHAEHVPQPNPQRPQHVPSQTSHKHPAFPHAPTRNSQHHTLLPPHPQTANQEALFPQARQPARSNQSQFATAQRTCLDSTAPAKKFNSLRCEVTKKLCVFLFSSSAMPPNEAILFCHMRTLWVAGKQLFRAELSNFDLVHRNLEDWIREREVINYLRCHKPSSEAHFVDAVLARDELRTVRVRWANIRLSDGLDHKDLLCTAFRVMTGITGLEVLFREPLDVLDKDAFQFLDEHTFRITM